MEQDIIDKITEELSLCYEAIGRKTPESVTIISASLQDAIHFQSVAQVHECFKRAKDVESIPTQRTLKEALKNYGEEFLKYDDRDNGSKALEFKDTRAAWLPKETFKKRINLQNAIKNYCSAIGGSMYHEYCLAHATTEKKAGDRRVIEWANPDKANAFDRPIKEYLQYIYTKYWRALPIANGYPAEAKLNLGLIPPTIDEFKTILKNEGVI